MSRAYNARRKARRRAQAAAEKARLGHPGRFRLGYPTLLPAIAIAAVLAAVAVLGTSSSTDVSHSQVRKEVSALLAGLPQDGRTLGSRQAPITLWMFADLECSTVKRFVEAYLPSIIETWVRSGAMRIEYRSLQTDTDDERTFFEQEAAALAAGRQDRMWNYLLTFLYLQGGEDTGYVSDEFLTEIAGQVHDLELGAWRRDRDDADLFKQVALGVQAGRSGGVGATPSFVISLFRRNSDSSGEITHTKEKIESSLRKELRDLGEENLGDVPTISAYLGGARNSEDE